VQALWRMTTSNGRPPRANGTPKEAIDYGMTLALPALPPAEIMLHTSLKDARSREALRIVGAAVR